MSNYFDQFNEKHFIENIEKLEKYAKENHVPIIMKDSLLVIFSLLDLVKPKRILEIGTAIAYSSILMANYTNAKIDTIERNEQMYELALLNIKEFKMEDKVKVFFDDALLIDTKKLKKYDVIFIDAAKAQNIKFFEKFSPLLKKKGIIVTDNLLFHGVVENKEASKNVLKMAEKIDAYNHYLTNLKNYETIFLNVGDGLSITRRK